VAHRFKRGHRIRIALSESLWPLVWPSPRIATLTVELGQSAVVLPRRPMPAAEEPFAVPLVAQGGQDLAAFLGLPPDESVEQRPDGRVIVRRDSTETEHAMPDVGTFLVRGGTESNEITEGDPNSCVWKQENIVGYKRSGWDCRTVAGYEISCTAESFLIEERLRITKGGELFFEHESVKRIPRDLV
jgi:uncharacterized protein